MNFLSINLPHHYLNAVSGSNGHTILSSIETISCWGKNYVAIRLKEASILYVLQHLNSSLFVANHMVCRLGLYKLLSTLDFKSIDPPYSKEQVGCTQGYKATINSTVVCMYFYLITQTTILCQRVTLCKAPTFMQIYPALISYGVGARTE